MTSKSQIANFLYEKCKENTDLLWMIVNEYVDNQEVLGDEKLDELEDFLANNFGDDW